MYMYMVRYLTGDGRNIKANEYYKYSYGGGESTQNPHQAWQIGTKAKAEKKMEEVAYGLAVEIVETFVVSQRELDENPMLQKAYDDFRMAQKLTLIKALQRR